MKRSNLLSNAIIGFIIGMFGWIILPIITVQINKARWQSFKFKGLGLIIMIIPKNDIKIRTNEEDLN